MKLVRKTIRYAAVTFELPLSTWELLSSTATNRKLQPDELANQILLKAMDGLGLSKRSCLNCEIDFLPRRSTKKFCSDKCRVAHCRERNP